MLSLQAFVEYFAWPAPLMLLLGIVIGFVFGVIPGLAGPQAMALVLPITYAMQMEHGLILLFGIAVSATFAGSITSILFGIPGTPINAATVLDGYPLAKQGRASYAIGAAGSASAMGGLFSALIFVLLLPFAKQFVYAFSYPEFFMLGLSGIIFLGSLSQGAVLRGWAMGFVGMFLACVGFDSFTSAIRFSFGSVYLWSGITIIPVTIGLFAIGETINLFVNRISISKQEAFSYRGLLSGVMAVIRHPITFLKGALIGVYIGVIPGIGGAVAQFLAYSSAMAGVKDKSKFGQGDIRGVVAAEASNNAKDGGALLTTLIFGIPGSLDMAILLGAFVIFGLYPGPALLRDQPEVVSTLLLTLILANVLVVVIGFMLIRVIARITSIPGTIIGTVVFSFALVGAYATNGKFGDVIVALIFGIIGYFMIRLRYSRVCLILGLILGPIIEQTFRQTLVTFGFAAFVNRPISAALLIINLLVLFYPLFKKMLMNTKKAA